MSDYISREAAIETAIDAVDDWDGGSNLSREAIIREWFGHLRTIDVRENVHGEWLDLYVALSNGLVLKDSYKCSICGAMWTGTAEELEDLYFCPSCGADMRGGNT